MMKKYYNREYLPILPDVDTSVYPYLLLGKHTNGSYLLLASSTNDLDYYPVSKNGLLVGTACTVQIYVLANASSEWTLQTNQASFAVNSVMPTSGYELCWGNMSLFDSDNFYIYYFEEMIPVDFCWNSKYSQIPEENKVKFEVDGVTICLHRVLDEVITLDQIDQIMTMTGGYIALLASTSYSDIEIKMLEAQLFPDLDIKSLNPSMSIGNFCYICPYDNFVVGEFTIPKKGIYCLDASGLPYSSDATILETQVGFNLPTIDPVVIYEGSVTTSGAAGAATANIQLNEFVGDRELVFTTVNNVEYFDKAFLNGESVIFGDLNDNLNPSFENRPYNIAVLNANSKTATVTTNNPGTYNIKITRYMSGQVNKYPREIDINLEGDTLFIEAGNTYQLNILSDNANAENPTYTFTGNSTFTKIGSVSETGLVTVTSTPVAGTITLSSEDTENYHDFKKYIYIDDSTRTISASILGNCANIGLSKKLEITDNATAQSPTYTYSSSNTSIATVDADGNVTGIAPGVVSITINSPATKNYKAGSTVITFYCEEYIAPLDRMIYDYEFNFSDEDWAIRFPECYSVSNLYAWYTDYTFTYNNRRTLRSFKGLSNSKVSKTQIKFNLLQPGGIDFNYIVSSENNCDWIIITLDGVEIIKKSGTVNWTDYTKDLDVGEHTLILQYSKDGSQNVGSDAAGIGYLRIRGMNAPYDKKYLIRHNNIIYTLQNNVLTSLGNTLTANVFRNNGFDTAPTWEQLSTLTNPEVLLWYDSEEYAPKLTVGQLALPLLPQSIITNDIDLSHPTITGINTVLGGGDGAPTFACEFAGNLKIHNGTSWVAAGENEGMSLEALTSITTAQWSEAINGLNSFKIKIMLNNPEDCLYGLLIYYDVDVTKAV